MFCFKGIIANLLIQLEPKPWNERWNAGVEEILRRLELPELNRLKKPIKYQSGDTKLQWSLKSIRKSYEKVLNDLKDFSKWVNLADAVKKLMEKGIINFDIISNKTLFILLSYED